MHTVLVPTEAVLRNLLTRESGLRTLLLKIFPYISFLSKNYAKTHRTITSLKETVILKYPIVNRN